MRPIYYALSVVVLVLAALVVAPGFGEEEIDREEALAMQSQNPVANLMSIPFQNNTSFGIGPHNRTQNVLNIQPVIPFNLNEDWNLITRTICPLIYQPFVSQSSGGKFGLGDINFSPFLSPAKPGAIIWGAGPILSFPTATDETLGTEKWSAGPSVVVLTMQGPWVIGALVNNLWDYAGASDRAHVNQMLIQYFVNYNLPDGWYLLTAPINTANWKAPSGEKWTVPVGGGVGKVMTIGDLPVNASVQAYSHVEKPTGAADWSMRLQVQFLFPMGS